MVRIENDRQQKGSRGSLFHEPCLLLVALEEAGEAADGILQLLFAGQEHQPEVIRRRPVEAGALHQQQFFLLQQVEHHLLVVANVIHLGVEAREHVERTLGFDAGYSGDLVQEFPRLVPLLAQATARQDQLVDALVAAKRSLNGVLHRHVGTQSHGGQHLQPFNVTASTAFGAGDDHPALTEAAGAVGLGEAVEGHHHHIVA